MCKLFALLFSCKAALIAEQAAGPCAVLSHCSAGSFPLVSTPRAPELKGNGKAACKSNYKVSRFVPPVSSWCWPPCIAPRANCPGHQTAPLPPPKISFQCFFSHLKTTHSWNWWLSKTQAERTPDEFHYRINTVYSLNLCFIEECWQTRDVVPQITTTAFSQ